MQYVNAMVAIGGNANCTVEVYEKSVPHIAVLRQIHGPRAVSDIKIVGEKETRPVAEKAELLAFFNKKEHHDIIHQMFPGMKPRFPESIDELGADEGNLDGADQEEAARLEALGGPVVEVADVPGEPEPTPADAGVELDPLA